jgi:hypothetical protein
MNIFIASDRKREQLEDSSVIPNPRRRKSGRRRNWKKCRTHHYVNMPFSRTITDATDSSPQKSSSRRAAVGRDQRVVITWGNAS